MADFNEKISAEIENISKIVLEVKKLLMKSNLDKYQINSAALYLHNFYNGVENIFKQFIAEYNLKVKNSSKWHKELLDTCYLEKVINKSLYNKLKSYLQFRHFVAHSYTFNYEYELFKNLVVDLEVNYNDFYKQVLPR